MQDKSFSIGDCIEVLGPGPKCAWYAQIHEIRALNHRRVYLLVSWLDRPKEDLQIKTQEVDGVPELVPSTELDVIDAKSINGYINVKHCRYRASEEKSKDHKSFYWKRAYDFTKKVFIVRYVIPRRAFVSLIYRKDCNTSPTDTNAEK